MGRGRQPLGQPGVGLGGSGFDQLYGDHGAATTHVADPVVDGLQRRQPVGHQAFDLAGPISQGEFIAVSKLEAVFGDSPLVRQIFIYGNSARAYPLAVVVPSGDALSRHGIENLKPVISESLQEVARAAGLQSYEIPRDFIIETTPFTLENGLLTGIRKLARPQLKKFYGERLERLYTELADSQSNELRELRQSGPDAPVLPTLCRAAAALLGSTAADVRPDAHFADLGGDSLSALSLANLLHEIFGVDVP